MITALYSSLGKNKTLSQRKERKGDTGGGVREREGDREREQDGGGWAGERERERRKTQSSK